MRAYAELLDRAAEVLAAGDLLTRIEKTIEQQFLSHDKPDYMILDFLHVMCAALERDDIYQELVNPSDFELSPDRWLAEHSDVFAVYRPWQKYVPWLGQQIAKGVRGIEAILPYVRQDSEPNFWALLAKGTQGLSLQQIIDDFSKKKNLAVLQGEVVQKLSNNWTLQKLTTKEQLAQEGQILDHCVGGYWAAVRDGKTEIYSVRDETGTPQATIEWKEKSIHQIYGKSDTPFERLDSNIQRHVREAVMGFFNGNFAGRMLMKDQFTAEELEKLAGDDDPDVRYWVAKHPNTPIRVLEKLAGDEKPGVRYGIAQHPNTPSGALEKLAGDDDPDVRRWVAKHPNTPIRVLEKLAGDEKPGVRYWVAENPNTPIRVLEKLAGDDDPDVRHMVARHPNTPISALEKLAGDENSSVRRAAQESLTRRNMQMRHNYQTSGMLTDAAAKHQGVMVCFYPSKDVAEQFAVEGGEPAANMHVTLAYLGKMDELPDDAIDRAIHACESVAGKYQAFEGEIGGIGRWAAGDDKDVVYASVDIPGSNEFRAALSEALTDAGVAPKANHGWTAHMTIQYVKDHKNDVKIHHIDPVGVKFDAIWVVCADDERHEIKLNGKQQIQAASATSQDLDAFMKSFYAASHANPLNDQERLLGYEDKGEEGWVAVGLRPFDGAIHIGNITSTNTGKGFASEALKEVCSLADKHGVRLTLFPKRYGARKGDLSSRQLAQWYQRYGFKRDPDSGDMERAPKTTGNRSPAEAAFAATMTGIVCANMRAVNMFQMKLADTMQMDPMEWIAKYAAKFRSLYEQAPLMRQVIDSEKASEAFTKRIVELLRRAGDKVSRISGLT